MFDIVLYEPSEFLSSIRIYVGTTGIEKNYVFTEHHKSKKITSVACFHFGVTKMGFL